MSVKTKHTESFHSGQNTNAKDKGEKVKIVSNASQSPSSDPATGVDHLRVALSHRDSYIPSDTHIWSHTTTVTPIGAHYDPRGEFGKVAEKGKATGLGGAPNRKGENALGKAMNKIGEKSGYPKGGKLSGVGGKRV